MFTSSMAKGMYCGASYGMAFATSISLGAFTEIFFTMTECPETAVATFFCLILF